MTESINPMYQDHPTSDHFRTEWMDKMEVAQDNFGQEGEAGTDARIMSEVGHRLYERRLAMHLSLWDVAWKLGVPENTMALAEQGILDVEDFISLLGEWTQLLQVNQDELVISVTSQIAEYLVIKSAIQKSLGKTE